MTQAAAEDAGSRGSLEIKERAISRTAIAAALKNPRVTRTTGGLLRLTGRELPRADVTVGEDACAVNLYIGVRWPSQIADVTADVQRSVESALTTMTGLHVHRVNVLVSDTTAERGTDFTSDTEVAQMVPPRTPTAGPAAMPVALFIGFALLVAAFVTGREFLIVHGSIDGAPWLADAVDWVARVHWQKWMVVVAAAAVIFGLLLVFVGIKPRTKTHSGLSETVWATPTDIARLCSAAARSTGLVVSAHTVVTRRKISVRVERDAALDAEPIDTAVREALRPVLTVAAGNRKLTVENSVAAPAKVA